MWSALRCFPVKAVILSPALVRSVRCAALLGLSAHDYRGLRGAGFRLFHAQACISSEAEHMGGADMVSRFLRELAQAVELTRYEIEVLSAADVRSFADMDSLVRWFPTIVDLGVRLPFLSNLAAQHVSAAYSEVAASAPTRIQMAGVGADPPPGTPWPVGTPAPLPPPAGVSPTPPGRIDLRAVPWPRPGPRATGHVRRI